MEQVWGSAIKGLQIPHLPEPQFPDLPSGQSGSPHRSALGKPLVLRHALLHQGGHPWEGLKTDLVQSVRNQ